ncbi:AAA family ATPase [Desulfoscipio gibsoniae]|uniref:CobQ/CobB/MinD/ParA nucleotide binding domain-containing protein n=1 Tax=Desulfoscipio gibsoniae DSM 7213 TaxID=767817 RepID=R4KC72_9FIRM|nr:hypothetical protein [Desulfoscipio gibsoniae]AGL00164.1 CobQ/CobB/MinD/ParA nucleotide binding domain-containing protein [Desulfoscipio gibsoniae DSM 7213]
MKTISVYGITKKSGNTTIAEELALISQNKGYRTLLVDLDIHTGDVTKRLQLNRHPNISDWCEDIYLASKEIPIINVQYTQSQWAQFLQKHPSGLDVLATNSNRKLPGYGNIYYEIKIIYNSLKASDYDVIVFDMSNIPTSFSYMVLEDVDLPILVVDTFRYNLKLLKHFIWDLEDVHFPVEKFKLLFNREPSAIEDSPEVVAQDYKIPVLGVLPEIDKGRTSLTQDEFNKRVNEIFEKFINQ